METAIDQEELNLIELAQQYSGEDKRMLTYILAIIFINDS